MNFEIKEIRIIGRPWGVVNAGTVNINNDQGTFSIEYA